MSFSESIPVSQMLTTDIRAIGLQSFSPEMEGFFGTGIMVERLKQEGTSHISSGPCEYGGQLVSGDL